MHIHFFEESPSEQALAYARHIYWDCTIYLASTSWAAYAHYKAILHAINPRITAGYWPILDKTYSASTFAQTTQLKRIERQAAHYDDPVLLDLELPLRTPHYILKNIFAHNKHKKILYNIMKHKHVLTLEHTPTPLYPHWLRKLLALTHPDPDKRIPKYYTSSTPWWIKIHYRKQLVYTQPHRAAIGIIAHSSTHKALMHRDELKRDLDMLKAIRAKHVYIYRLGGIKQEYRSIINRFVNA